VLLASAIDLTANDNSMPTTNEPATTAEQIVRLERAALDRWGNGDPGGFLELYAPDITYFDPSTPERIDGHPAMAEYYRPWVGRIQIPRYEMRNPHVVVGAELAVLTYNLVNYVVDATGTESVGTSWNSTVVYRNREVGWQSIHSHWSYTQHPAFRTLTPEESERQAS
jgi:ketosteroid isomerase-like protein